MASLFPPQIQLVSDLHLETPIARPSYTRLKLPICASYLCLLGDIGLVKDAALYEFLEKLLKSTPNLKIFYVFGNHEAYQVSMETAIKYMTAFENRMRDGYGERFIFLHRRRYDLNSKITVLGCTLWSRVPDEQATEVQQRLTDFHEFQGIQNWSLEKHQQEHQKDLNWLNECIRGIHESEPHREVIVLTHHSPTTDPRANDPAHESSSIKSGFVTDLSAEICWTSPCVKMWAFGHTHFNCGYHDESTGKLVIANQKGYTKLGDMAPTINTAVVEATGRRWALISNVTLPKPSRLGGHLARST